MFPDAGAPMSISSRSASSTAAAGRDLRGWEDWPYIKKEHNKLYRAMARIDGHVILTAEQAGLGDTGEKKDDKALFARFGYRPAGRKQIAGTVATVAHLSRDSSGQQYLTTFKDRGRELVSGVPISDFFRDYMVKIAGWRMAGSARRRCWRAARCDLQPDRTGPAAWRADAVSMFPESFGADLVVPIHGGGWAGIQRKEIADLCASIEDNRLSEQLVKLRQLTMSMLIVEGEPSGRMTARC